MFEKVEERIRNKTYINTVYNKTKTKNDSQSQPSQYETIRWTKEEE